MHEKMYNHLIPRKGRRLVTRKVNLVPQPGLAALPKIKAIEEMIIKFYSRIIIYYKNKYATSILVRYHTL